MSTVKHSPQESGDHTPLPGQPDTERVASDASGEQWPATKEKPVDAIPVVEGGTQTANETPEEMQHGMGPGMCDDGRPKFINMDWVTFKEMIERRNNAVLQTSFGHVEGLAATFKTDLERGIDPTTHQARTDQFGENLLSKKEPVTFLEFVLEAFQDQIVLILCVAATVSIIFGMTLPNPHSGHVEREHGWIEGTAILISILLVTGTGSINNYQKAKKFEEMERASAIKQLQVFRGGEEITISSEQLVPGDILVVETGMELSCDGVYVSGSDIKVSESALTGEPDLIEKDRDNAFFISGTTIDEGNGKILVIAVGMGAFQGTLKNQLDVESGETPLQEHLGELADNIGKFGLGGAVVLLAALSIKEGILIGKDEKEANATSFLNFFLIAITLIAVAIPEGLPLAVTISLAFSMKAMMKENCMVRVLASCETMGAATAICSDKTGTLTTNQMTVVQGALMDHEFIIEGYGLNPRAEQVQRLSRSGDGEAMVIETPNISKDNLERFCYALSVNSTARESLINHQLTWVGNKTEFGLLKWVKAMGRDYAEMRKQVPADCVRQYPFSSAKKRMSTIIKDNAGQLIAYFKGASEAILASSDRCMDENGTVVELTDARRAHYEALIVDMANQGNRTIGVALCVCDFSEFPDDEPSVPTVFLGVVGIQDPIRTNVPLAVLDSESAGLTVRMVTGDNINTAIAIAKKCNIYKDDGFDLAMTGEDFRVMFRESRETLVPLLPRIKILARSSPQDKHILVGLLQDEYGEVVGVTGDGTNDAPALKLADVGFAMNTGTDIARDASDMILLDDNFATVVTAIRWGRAVNDNIKKFLQFQLSINFAGVGLTLIGSLASSTSKEPFTPVQLLWLNLIMDTLAAIALATELPEDACLHRAPVFKQAPLITKRMWCFIGCHGVFQFTLIMLIMFLGHDWFDVIEERDTCKHTYADIPTLETYVQNTSGVLTNATRTIYIRNPVEEACRLECEDEGGVFHADTRRCQQGAIHSTIIFNTFIWFQIFNVINSRKIYGEKNPVEGLFTRSQNLLYVFGIILALQVIAVELFGRFMSTKPLKWHHWLICVGLGALEFVVGILQRFIPMSDYVPDFVERKAARLLEMREEVKGSHILARKDSAIRRSSMQPTGKSTSRRGTIAAS
jgi:Ca2+-transporting ATPase